MRLISLASWTFTSETGTGDFGYVMRQLNIGPLTVPVTVTGTDTASQLVAAAVADGYTLLGYTTRLGEQTAAWYRGPLLPSPVAANPQPAYPAAAAALIYDPSTGMFDTSYAAAWEIGRLLTLANGPVASSLATWVGTAASAVRLLAARGGTAAARWRCRPRSLLAPASAPPGRSSGNEWLPRSSVSERGGPRPTRSAGT